MKWFSVSALLLALVQTQALKADNVSAKISGGSLYIYGDDGSNQITIESTSPGSITVSGSPTTVNGNAAPVTLNGWNNGVFVYMGAGSDSVWLKSGDIIGATHFDLGSGDDNLLIGSSVSIPEEFLLDPIFELIFPDANEETVAMLRMRQSLTVLGFAGADRVLLTNCTVVGASTFDMAGGHDEVYLGSDSGEILTFFQNQVVIVPGSEPDSTSIVDVQINRDLIIDDPTSAATVEIVGSRIGGNMQIFGSTAVDDVYLNSLVVTGFVKAILKDGDDDFECSTLQAKQMELFLGAGSDKATVSGVKLETMWSYLEDGSDNYSLDQSSIKNSYYYGAGGNDYFTIQNTSGTAAFVYGDAGTDTLKQSGNSIGKVNVYSVERRL